MESLQGEAVRTPCLAGSKGRCKGLEMHGIPTIYKGIRFRSRLEARWAAFFDLLKWDWAYESVDCNGWIPDFSIKTNDLPLLVEVKGTWQAPIAAIQKAIRALGNFEKHHVLFCGNGLFSDTYTDGCIGWISDDFLGGEHDNIDTAILIKPTHPAFRFGLAAGTTGSYQDRITGVHDGDHHYSPVGLEIVYDLWARACNATQWKAPR